jgi:hypothetical protein
MPAMPAAASLLPIGSWRPPKILDYHQLNRPEGGWFLRLIRCRWTPRENSAENPQAVEKPVKMPPHSGSGAGFQALPGYCARDTRS